MYFNKTIYTPYLPIANYITSLSGIRSVYLQHVAVKRDTTTSTNRHTLMPSFQNDHPLFRLHRLALTSFYKYIYMCIELGQEQQVLLYAQACDPCKDSHRSHPSNRMAFNFIAFPKEPTIGKYI